MRIARAHLRKSFSCELGQTVNFRRLCRATGSRLKGNITSLTYQICEVTVTLPSLGSITTDGPGNQIKHGDKCRVDLYAVKPDWRSGSHFEGFIVGWLTYQGYCETPCERSQKIMMPAGYKLVALMVDEYGTPKSWDSLPVQFSGGPIGTAIDALDGIADLPLYSISSDRAIQQKIADALDTALTRHHVQYGNSTPEKTPVVFLAERWVALEGKYTVEEIRDAVEHIKRKRKEKADAKALAESSPFDIKDGQVFINDAVIGNRVGSGWRITNGIASHNFIPKKDISDHCQQGESRVKILAEKLSVAANTQNALETALQQSIKKVVDEAIQQAMRPGGVIWEARSRGI